VWHRGRAEHLARHPVHLTFRARAGLPSLRTRRLLAVVLEVITAVAHRLDCRIVHFSVQDDHVHLIVEADDERALSAGARGFSIRVAKALNRALGRRGPVWDSRYHRRDLTTPTETRWALLYVLANWLEDHPDARGLDPCSSAAWFDGWQQRARIATPPGPPPVAPAHVWLLTTGWQKAGPLSVRARPRPPARRLRGAGAGVADDGATWIEL
jgi:REP element-mobilizing transposase RayT